MDLEAARATALEKAAHIDANVKAKILKRARKHGAISQDEAVALVEAWKRAARPTKRLYHEYGWHKGVMIQFQVPDHSFVASSSRSPAALD